MTRLTTNAEKKALEALNLPGFRGLALGDCKERVAEMLDMIGRVEGVFSTYTRHDISHVDAMLQHLDWLIPPKTQEAMTPVDWLLIVLAIYFHDLGMLVTTEEYEKRYDNEAFAGFLEGIEKDPKAQDYLGRAKKMSEGERETFFFQEFIREHHPTRIGEWITGRHSRHWGKAVTVIADAISDIIQRLPSRFRENLATVCISHHESNLNRVDLYPLCQRYGNQKLETANVQYAALMLRTADLVHVTKDRTPSTMYRIIKLSDPKGVTEWDKQKDTFAVWHAGRRFDANDTSTHVITVGADFTEERPFFALTEYLVWADTEIKQTKRWSDQSRESEDAADFWFPWHTIRGDLRVAGNQPQQMRFEFDRGRLLDLLVGHAIYNDPTVAIRELLQNSIDAVRFQHHLDMRKVEAEGDPLPTTGSVAVSWDPRTRRLVVEDSGTGMDLDTIRFHLMCVGASFYDTPQFALEHKGFNAISRFGIGVLTCFMISDDIEIVTFRGTSGHRIKMTSVQADYLLRELAPGDPILGDLEPHGTRVTLTVREGVNLEERSVESILRYWVVLPACPVRYREAGHERVRVGYDSPSEALSSFVDEYAKGNGLDRSRFEVIAKQRTVDGGTYEMALAVEASWFPERQFAAIEWRGVPAVCIEGVCVSEDLPGFRSALGPKCAAVALVSVRGVRSLRTTVSRYGLEEDDASARLGEICGEMMFEHVRDELQRIASGKGKPLSRASTAAQWLSTRLVSMSLRRGRLEAHLEVLRESLPMLVLESRGAAADPEAVDRRLVSIQDLRAIESFWTIEARLVDSLGIISRDLGREVSLAEFLRALAPDLEQLRHSPIVPDAHVFGLEIMGSHCPAEVRFSRRNQQTSIRWVPGRGDDMPARCRQLGESFVTRLDSELERFSIDDAFDTGRSFMAPFPTVIAKITGDDDNIVIVNTRIISIIAAGSALADLWSELENAMKWSLEKLDPGLFVRLMALRNLLDAELHGRHRQLFLTNLGLPRRSALGPKERRIWEEQVAKVNAALCAGGGDMALPAEMAPIVPEMIFDACAYWLDWHRDARS